MSETNRSNGAAVLDTAVVRRLTVADILAADDIVEEDVHVPEWCPVCIVKANADCKSAVGSVRVRAFTKAKQQELRRMAIDPRSDKIDSEKLELQIFIHGVIDPQFEPVQATELRGKSAGAVDRVLKRIMAISGMTEEAVTEARKSVSD